MKKIYRKNVAAIILNNDNCLLACHRADKKGVWQLPQGGIDEGEEPKETLFRELQEEIGTAEVEVIAQLEKSIKYDWPPHLYSRGFHGQEQVYFLLRIKEGAKINLKLHHQIEFDKYQWMSISEFINIIYGFKAEAYKSALNQFAKLYPHYINIEA